MGNCNERMPRWIFSQWPHPRRETTSQGWWQGLHPANCLQIARTMRSRWNIRRGTHFGPAGLWWGWSTAPRSKIRVRFQEPGCSSCSYTRRHDHIWPVKLVCHISNSAWWSHTPLTEGTLGLAPIAFFLLVSTGGAGVARKSARLCKIVIHYHHYSGARSTSRLRQSQNAWIKDGRAACRKSITSTAWVERTFKAERTYSRGSLSNHRPLMRSPMTMTQRAASRDYSVASHIAAFCLNRGSRSKESAFGGISYCTVG